MEIKRGAEKNLLEKLGNILQTEKEGWIGI